MDMRNGGIKAVEVNLHAYMETYQQDPKFNRSTCTHSGLFPSSGAPGKKDPVL